jgi:hypothetical protein
MSVTPQHDSDGILLVAPVPPPYGGMALQAGLLQRMLESDGMRAEVLGYNQPFALSFLDRIPALRTFLRAARFTVQCYSRARYCKVIHVLAASRLYFFLIVCPAVLIGRTLGKPVILNYRGGDADQFLRRYSKFVKPFFKMAANVTAPSEFLVGVIQRRIGVPVSVVPNIVNFSKFHYRSRGPFRP